MDKVRIRVPATSANLGSGFDCLGMAFQRYNVFEFEKIPFGIVARNIPTATGFAWLMSR